MKNTLKLLLLFLVASSAQAQISTTLQKAMAPDWGPVGYSNATYYYLPDVQTYYDINKRQYVYLNNGKWVRNTKLPAAHRGYNLYNGYKVVLTDPTPYKHYHVHKTKYKKGYKGKYQKNIGSRGKGNGKVGHPGYKGKKEHAHKGNSHKKNDDDDDDDHNRKGHGHKGHKNKDD